MLSRIIIIFLLGAVNLFATEMKKMQFIDIAECSIPIDAQFELIDQSNMNGSEYSYFEENKLVDNAHLLRIRKRQPLDYKKRKNNINEFKWQIVSETKYRGFKVLEYKSEGIFVDLHHFALFGPKSMISIMNSSRNNVDYLLDYCAEHKRYKHGIQVNRL